MSSVLLSASVLAVLRPRATTSSQNSFLASSHEALAEADDLGVTKRRS
jgi:hypothetical protein